MARPLPSQSLRRPHRGLRLELARPAGAKYWQAFIVGGGNRTHFFHRPVEN